MEPGDRERPAGRDPAGNMRLVEAALRRQGDVRGFRIALVGGVGTQHGQIRAYLSWARTKIFSAYRTSAIAPIAD
jgi:hypothetical protein